MTGGPSVSGHARKVSGTAKAAPKVGGPVRGTGQILGRTRALRPPGVADFSVRHPKGALQALLRPSDEDALRCRGLGLLLPLYDVWLDTVLMSPPRAHKRSDVGAHSLDTKHIAPKSYNR